MLRYEFTCESCGKGFETTLTFTERAQANVKCLRAAKRMREFVGSIARAFTEVLASPELTALQLPPPLVLLNTPPPPGPLEDDAESQLSRIEGKLSRGPFFSRTLPATSQTSLTANVTSPSSSPFPFSHAYALVLFVLSSFSS